MSEGKHFDDGKPRVDLISPAALIALGNVLGYGAKKYGDKNWLGGIAWTKLYGSALRHLIAWRAGTDQDPESGLPHLDHALCNVMMLVHFAYHEAYQHHDDRHMPVVPSEEPPLRLSQIKAQLEAKFRPEDWRQQPVVIDKGQAGVQR